VYAQSDYGAAHMDELIQGSGVTNDWQDAETQPGPGYEEHEVEEEEAGEDGCGEDDEEEGDAEEDDEEEGDGEEEEGAAPRTGKRGPKWKVLEDKCLIDAWKTVSIDPITGANQASGAYWARIKKEFDERKYLDKEYKTMVMKRSQKAMSTRWGNIQKDVNVFHGIHGKIEARPASGMNAELMVSVHRGRRGFFWFIVAGIAF
jgi:hypothetical protein